MAKRSTAVSVVRRALGTLFGNLPVFLPVAFCMGLLLAVLDMWVYSWLAPEAATTSAQVQQSALIKLMFGWWGVMLALEILLGPIVVGMTVYTARAHSHGGKATLYKAFNFALARYGRIFKWHAIAWLTIQVGMIVLVPGILFLLQYAFVDSILCLEDEKWPLARSTKLTRGRRRRIFAIVFVWLVVNQVVGFLELGFVEQGIGPLTGLMGGIYLLNIFVMICFYLFYEDRTTP
jgi:hypothetical protein